eukprot:1088013-Prymnesium_polylepis.1
MAGEARARPGAGSKEVRTEVMHGQARSTPIRCADATTERTRGEFCSSEDAHATRIMTTDRRLSQLA